MATGNAGARRAAHPKDRRGSEDGG